MQHVMCAFKENALAILTIIFDLLFLRNKKKQVESGYSCTCRFLVLCSFHKFALTSLVGLRLVYIRMYLML